MGKWIECILVASFMMICFLMLCWILGIPEYWREEGLWRTKLLQRAVLEHTHNTDHTHEVRDHTHRYYDSRVRKTERGK